MQRLKGVLLFILAAAALGLGAGSAGAQTFGQNKIQYKVYEWRSIASDHFEVYFYTGLDSLAMRVLDLAEKTNLVLSVRMGHQLGRRVPIILYGSHNEFSQTNVTPELIDQNTGGFTEPLRNRVVLPFTGSYEDLRHVVVHELTHAYMFDLLYGGSAATMIARQAFFSVPLWFAEGLAEYMSLGMESNAEMFLRDGVLEGNLPPLPYSGGYIVYKQGQSAISYFVDRYGEDRLRELLKRIHQMRGFDGAFERAAGISVARFDEQWREWLKRRYWPTIAVKQDPEQFARRLTDHRHDESYLNTAPSVSPQGDRVAYFSDRRQYTDVYVMLAINGRVLHRVIRGERSVKFESIPLLRASIAWAPDGNRLAVIAKNGGADVIYILSSIDGQLIKRIKMNCDALSYVAWSPVSDSLVVTGLAAGRSDLWLVNERTAEVTRLTNDIYDEKDPVWTPDGRRITFSSDRAAPVVLHVRHGEQGWGEYGIFDLDLATGAVTKVIDTAGDDHSPAWSPNGQELAFVSDRSGTPNLYLYETGSGRITQLTDVIGGVSNLSWSRLNDRLVFSAYNHEGIDVFAVKVPLSLEEVVTRIRREHPYASMTTEEAAVAPADSVHESPPRGALAGAWPDSLTVPSDTLSNTLDAHRASEPARRDSLGPILPVLGEPPAWSGGGYAQGLAPAPDTLRPLPSTMAIADHGGPFALPDSVLGQRPLPYRSRLALDYAGSALTAATGYGFTGAAQFLFSDFLGNRSLYIAADLFGGSIDQTNALAIFSYLPLRWDLSLGVFHFNNYYSGRLTTLGEQLSQPRLFSERNFGGLVGLSYPFDRFRRIDFLLTQTFLERQFYEQDVFGDYVVTSRQFRSISSPSVSLVSDNALWGYYGPVNGHRTNVTWAPAFGWFQHALAYQTVTLDARNYQDMTHGYTFATRLLGGVSTGRNPQILAVGGFSTLRGYSDFDLLGSRIAIINTEFRFPFIQQLGLVGPIPIGMFNLRGVGFFDAGLIWPDGVPLRWQPVRTALPLQNGYAVGFGGGIRSAIAYMILKLDVAWGTDFWGVSRPHWYFSIGPDF